VTGEARGLLALLVVALVIGLCWALTVGWVLALLI
jgi:hypothetical protein